LVNLVHNLVNKFLIRRIYIIFLEYLMLLRRINNKLSKLHTLVKYKQIITKINKM
jgi:hypothetical protein